MSFEYTYQIAVRPMMGWVFASSLLLFYFLIHIYVTHLYRQFSHLEAIQTLENVVEHFRYGDVWTITVSYQINSLCNDFGKILDLVFVNDVNYCSVSRSEPVTVPEDRYQATLKTYFFLSNFFFKIILPKLVKSTVLIKPITI